MDRLGPVHERVREDLRHSEAEVVDPSGSESGEPAFGAEADTDRGQLVDRCDPRLRRDVVARTRGVKGRHSGRVRVSANTDGSTACEDVPGPSARKLGCTPTSGRTFPNTSPVKHQRARLYTAGR